MIELKNLDFPESIHEFLKHEIIPGQLQEVCNDNLSTVQIWIGGGLTQNSNEYIVFIGPIFKSLSQNMPHLKYF